MKYYTQSYIGLKYIYLLTNANSYPTHYTISLYQFQLMVIFMISTLFLTSNFKIFIEKNIVLLFPDAACRSLGKQKGLLHCCNTFGYNMQEPLLHSYQCSDNDKTLQECDHVPSPTCHQQNYVAISCYDGELPTGKVALFIFILFRKNKNLI